MATVPAPMRLHRGPRGTEFGGARLHDPTCHVYACLGPADRADRTGLPFYRRYLR